MKFFNFLKRKKNLPLKRKSFFPLGGLLESLIEYGHSDLAAYVAVSLYNITAPLGNAVDIISSEFSSLTPQIKNDKKEIISDHPILELLRNPNADSSQSEFFYRICAFFLITGNSYFAATGNVRKEPLEVFSTSPQAINVLPNFFDGLTETFMVQTQSGARNYKREESGKRFRYYYLDEGELWQIKRFNPNAEELTGQSPISAILAEIDQYNYSSVHNRSLLKRGGRPSGILMLSAGKDASGNVSEPLTDDQYRRLKEQAERRLMGAENSGNWIIAEADGNIEYKDIITSNREMDYIAGKKDVRATIYNQYRIPLPLVSADHQTLANMETATDHLYDGAVLPVADRLFSELNLFLMPRYKRSDNLTLGYDKAAIPALQRRKTREVKEKRETGIYTINELRTLGGMEPLDEGGDMIYRPASEVPIANDQYTDDQLPIPPKTSTKRFAELMSLRGFGDDSIKKMSVDLGLK